MTASHDLLMRNREKVCRISGIGAVILLKMHATDLSLLEQFSREHSQDAFTALVEQHLNLVYSAALRQVRSPHLAEEVSQNVFSHLARNAGKLSPDTILTAWLYQVTRHAAVDVIRSAARRRSKARPAPATAKARAPCCRRTVATVQELGHDWRSDCQKELEK